MTSVKFCGMTSVEDALAAATAGASAIGLVFWPDSPRAVTATTARAIVAALPPTVLAIGVFVNATPEEVSSTVRTVGLHGAQLHGDERPERYVGAAPRLIKSAPVAEGRVLADLEGWPAGVWPLVDAHDPVRRGGTGRQVDWHVAADLARHRPIVLAGGLEADTVGTAILTVRPAWVDVSSGIETRPGRKAVEKMAAFMAAVRVADRAADDAGQRPGTGGIGEGGRV